MPERVEVLGVLCNVLEYEVPADVAHPDGSVQDSCTMCKIVTHPVTGKPVLVWGFGTGDFTVSRHDPNFPEVRDQWPVS